MLKVFLTEDERLVREGLRDMIPWEQYGFVFAGEASDGEMALPLVRKIKPDVLITDIKSARNCRLRKSSFSPVMTISHMPNRRSNCMWINTCSSRSPGPV